MWTCPECKKVFKNKNQWHSCAKLSLNDHLKNKPSHIVLLINEIIAFFEDKGPIEINPVKTSIQLRCGATFLSIRATKKAVKLEFQLGYAVEGFPISKCIKVSGSRYYHELYLDSIQEFDNQLKKWLNDAYFLIKG